MPEYTLTWKGDKVRDYKTKTGEPYRSCRIAVRDESGNRITKLELTRPANLELPEVGDVITGRVENHPRFDDLQRLVEGVGGEGSPSTNGGGSLGNSPSVATSRDTIIERQTCLKAAAVVVSSLVATGGAKESDVPNLLATFTEAGMDALRGRADEGGTDDKAAPSPAPATGVDDDIPF